MDKKKQKRVDAGRKGGIASAKSKQSLSDAQALNNTKQDKTKLKNTKLNNIKDRTAKFKKQVFEFANQYDEDLLNEFYSYWSEPNKSNTKMNFELNKTWDLSRRLKRWVDNDFGKNKSNGTAKQHNFKMPDGKNYLLYCSKCLKSDFYDPYNFKIDQAESRCCNSNLLAERPANV